jgi:hypothetical protein
MKHPESIMCSEVWGISDERLLAAMKDDGRVRSDEES